MLNSIAAADRARALRMAAERGHRPDNGESPVTRVTLRYAVAADAQRLRALAELESATAPGGAALVAEVDGRIRAALPLDRSQQPISDSRNRGGELLELLRLRAAQLADSY
jgi:hypothetical protein